MADSNIGDLPNLSDVQDNALLVVEFESKAYKLTGAQWKAYAVAAAQGVNKGDPGDDGVSPTVSVVDISGGHRVTITDAAGAKTFDVLNGADGSPGVSPVISVSVITGGHRVTITDASGTKSFDVLNGSDGSGSGDMLKSAYDSDETVKTAGGIVAYVSSVVGDINTILDDINGEVV